MYLCRLCDAHIHLDVEVLTFHIQRLCSNCVSKVAEGDDVRELVINGKRRIGEDAADIRTAEHIEPSAHLEVGKCSPKPSAKVDEHFAVSQRALLLRSIDELVVVGSYIHIQLHTLQVTEINITVEHQRRLACGVCLDSVEIEAAALHSNRMVGYLQIHVIAVGLDVKRVRSQFSI